MKNATSDLVIGYASSLLEGKRGACCLLCMLHVAPNHASYFLHYQRFLGTRDGVRLGFWRNLMGQSEKWLILKGTSRGVEDINARGSYVRCGDFIMLQTLEGMTLSLADGVDGKSAKLVHKDRIGAGGELWQIDWAGSQPTPQWMSSRPYLSGTYLLMSKEERYSPSSDILVCEHS